MIAFIKWFCFYCYQRRSLKFTLQDEKRCEIFPFLGTDQLRSCHTWYRPSRGRRSLQRTHWIVDRKWWKNRVKITRLIISVMNRETQTCSTRLYQTQSDTIRHNQINPTQPYTFRHYQTFTRQYQTLQDSTRHNLNPYTSRHNQTLSDTFRHYQTQLDTTRHNLTQTDTTKHYQTQPYTSRHNQTLSASRYIQKEPYKTRHFKKSHPDTSRHFQTLYTTRHYKIQRCHL